MTDFIQATHEQPRRTKEVFLIMYRYGKDSWVPSATAWDSLGSAQAAIFMPNNATAWKIVRVSGLPIEVPGRDAWGQ